MDQRREWLCGSTWHLAEALGVPSPQLRQLSQAQSEPASERAGERAPSQFQLNIQFLQPLGLVSWLTSSKMGREVSRKEIKAEFHYK